MNLVIRSFNVKIKVIRISREFLKGNGQRSKDGFIFQSPASIEKIDRELRPPNYFVSIRVGQEENISLEALAHYS